MIDNLFRRMNESTVVRKTIWRPIYDYLARRYTHVTDWKFMNYGYAFEGDTQGDYQIKLNPEDENDRFCMQLYHLTASVKNLNGLHVLEIGSGRGGGVYYVSKYLKPAMVTGIDISKEAVSFCTKNYNHHGMLFEVGDAENLHFKDQSFDVVINVESSLHYGNMDKFLSEVYRILKPGGIFSIADIRPKRRLPVFTAHIKNSGMTIIDEKDISPNIATAIELGDEQKNKRIEDTIRQPLKFLFKKFAGVKGSEVHQQLLSGERIYKHYILQKH